MDKPTKDGVKAAVDHLIEMQEIKQVRKWLDVLRDTVDAGVDFELRGDAAFLQPLMDLRAHSMEKYTSVMNAMDDHRAASGLDRISTRPDKAAYVAAFMPIKRGRETRLARLWNEQFSSSQQLKGDARKAFMAMHARRWTWAWRCWWRRATTRAGTRARSARCRCCHRHARRNFAHNHADR